MNLPKILKYIRMIELQIINDRDLRQIMHELAALIKKSSVIFVALSDEPFAIGKSRAF